MKTEKGNYEKETVSSKVIEYPKVNLIFTPTLSNFNYELI